jgi:capsular exopolysaccharide synthesis family protein
MSRIESALNRARALQAGNPDIGVVPDGTPEAELFVGPWDVNAEPPVPVADGTLAPAGADGLAPPSGSLRVASAGSTHFRDDVVEKLVASASGPAAAAVEQYRRLAAKLHQAQIDRHMNAVMVVSAVPSEGKTLTSVNLALTLSRSYKKRVLLIDADLRRPSLHEVCGLHVERGLQECVLEPADGELATAFEVAPGLALLPAGRPTNDPMSVLTSPRMRAILDEARRTFDWVIVDTAPMAALSDAQVLKDAVDGALLVVSAGNTPFELVDRAVQALGRDRLLGVVLNGVSEDAIGAAYGYADYYGRS